MILTCPACGARNSIEALLQDDAARRAVAAALQLPAPLGDLLLRYVGLFRPARRALSWDRAAALLEELIPPLREGKVVRDGRTWPAPQAAWKLALEEMLARRDTLTLPLKSHGYLYEVVIGAAKQAESRAETQREHDRRNTPQAHRARDDSAAAPLAGAQDEPYDPAKAAANRALLKSILKSSLGGGNVP